MVTGNRFYRRIITVGHDDRGNAIQYIDNENGTWTDLYEEKVVSEAFVMRSFPEYFVVCFHTSTVTPLPVES